MRNLFAMLAMLIGLTAVSTPASADMVFTCTTPGGCVSVPSGTLAIDGPGADEYDISWNGFIDSVILSEPALSAGGTWLIEYDGMAATQSLFINNIGVATRGFGPAQTFENFGTWVVGTATVPEPSTVALAALALFGLAAIHRGRRPLQN